jgi:hypothetical protein
LPNLINIIPIHIYSVYEHKILLFDPENDCEPVADIRKKILKQEKFKKYAVNFNKTYGDRLLNFINESKNIEKSNTFANWSYIDIFCDHFIADTTDLTDDTILERFKKNNINIDDLTVDCKNILETQIKDVVFGDEDVLIMSQSYHFRMLLNLMENRINLDKQNKNDYLDYKYPKFLMISAHDTTIGGIQKFMQKVFGTDFINPEFAANLYFDVFVKDEENGDKKYYVNYTNNDDVLETFEFTDFKNKINKVLWSDEKVKKFCKFKYIYDDDDDKNNTIFYIIIGILSFIIIVLTVAIILLIKKKKKDVDGLILQKI